jgi:hypothetical protein
LKASVAKKIDIHEAVDRFKKITDEYVQAPLVPKSEVEAVLHLKKGFPIELLYDSIEVIPYKYRPFPYKTCMTDSQRSCNFLWTIHR